MRIPGTVWWVAALICLVGAIVAGVYGLGVAAGSFTVATCALAFEGWRQRGPAPHTPWSPDLVAPGRAVVFWKDGCPYCHRLLRALAGDDRVTWVNVFRDKPGDVRVRELNGGDQLTPTAIVEDVVLINPSADEVRAALDGAGARA